MLFLHFKNVIFYVTVLYYIVTMATFVVATSNSTTVTTFTQIKKTTLNFQKYDLSSYKFICLALFVLPALANV